MNVVLESLIVCFSMYSALPMPHIQWNDKNMRYAFCFFPFIGLLIGGILSASLFALTSWITSGQVFSAMTLTVIPVLVTGGIHVDGYIDTCDAIFSHGDKEKKLQVLADPQAGAFGVIYSIVYFLAMFAVYTEFVNESEFSFFLLIFPFVISRSIGGIQAIHWRSAKESGLKYLFAEGTHEKPVLMILTLWIVVFVFLGAAQFPILTTVLGIWICSLLLFLRYYFYKEFGGITGDLIGFTICLVELSILIITVIYFSVIR